MAKKKHKIWIWITIPLIVILLAVAYFKGKNRRTGTEVHSYKVEKKNIVETVGASGKIFPETEVKISSDVSGEVILLSVEEGDTVRAGDVLAKIDPESYKSRVAQGQAGINSARVQMQQAKNNVQASEAQVAQAKSQFETQEANFNRKKSLYEQGVISKAEMEATSMELQSAKSGYQSALANAKTSKEGVTAAEYNIQSAIAGADELNTSLKRTTILSPTDGIVSLLNVEEGERVVGTIQMTGTELMRIADLDVMEARVEVSENDIVRVHVGDPVEVNVDAYYDKTFTGIVTEIANSASNISEMELALNTEQITNFIVSIRLDSESYTQMLDRGNPIPFRPGMTASVEIETNNLENVLAVPISAVTIEKSAAVDEEDPLDKDTMKKPREIVYKINADTVASTVVETGIQDNKHIQILSGLQEGDEIVSGPYSTITSLLRDGSKVSVEDK